MLEQADYFRLVTPHQTADVRLVAAVLLPRCGARVLRRADDYYQNGNYFTINAPEYVYDPFFKAEYTF